MKELLALVLSLVLLPFFTSAQLFEEKNGFVQVEAESFYQQSETDIRKWYIFSEETTTNLRDVDPNHAATASGKAYIEILPDTRTNHDETLIRGENFENTPGKVAIVHYKVKFNTPGRYYVWASAHSTGTEDNGIHVGFDGEWPASGQRMQWCEGKNAWFWASKQRTEEVHCGVQGLIYLDIENAGEHEIHFSMREDGFEMDEWLMTTDIDYDPNVSKMRAVESDGAK